MQRHTAIGIATALAVLFGANAAFAAGEIKIGRNDDSTTFDPIKTILNGAERQNYPVSDMFFPPHKLVAALSKDVTLLPGDLIACGTSLGVGTMKEPKNAVEIVIEGVGKLANTFDQ